ncbi:aminotransferase class V-fold PLP-dependent enzyme, partial [Staphylococcus epidermidis]
LLSFLAEYKNVFINSPQNASPHIINIGFPGVKGEVLVNAFSKQNVMVSTTSACSSKMNKLNEVLLAMEIAESKIEGSIRISLGAHTTENDILSFMNAFESVYKEIKELLK